MNKDHIFVDTNVLIGAVLLQQKDRDCLQYLFSLHGKHLYISALSIAQLVSVFQKKKTNTDVRKIVEYLLTKFHVISFSEKDIVESLSLNQPDMEDNIQYIISQKFDCFIFVTNNKNDYSKFTYISVVEPKRIRLCVVKS